MKIELTFMDKIAALDHYLHRLGMSLEGTLGISRASILHWASGRNFPSPATAIALEEFTEGWITREDVIAGRVAAASVKPVPTVGNLFDPAGSAVVAVTTPIARKAAQIRERAQREAVAIHERWGVSRMTSYNWLSGRGKPHASAVPHLIAQTWGILTPEDFVVEDKGTRAKVSRGRPRRLETTQIIPSPNLPTQDIFDIFG